MESWQEDLLSWSCKMNTNYLKSSNRQHRIWLLCLWYAVTIIYCWTIMLNNYPQAWQQRYVEQQRSTQLFSTVWFHWNLLSAIHSYTSRERLLGGSAFLNVGWAQSSRDFIGTRGMLQDPATNYLKKNKRHNIQMANSNCTFQHC